VSYKFGEFMEKESTSLRQKTINALQEQNRSLTFRELTDAIWAMYPEYKDYLIGKYETEQQARVQQRTRLGIVVRDNRKFFTVTKSESRILVGLSAELFGSLENYDEEQASQTSHECVYWYTFPAYKKDTDAYPIVIGRGNVERFGQWYTDTPEPPELLGFYEHAHPRFIQNALHSVLELKGRRVEGASLEWFLTTPKEINELIESVLKLV
jgi:hypothetical protein